MAAGVKMAMMIYKIVSAAEWRQAQTDGVFRGAPIDLKDGYIHFSTADQVAETAARHFAGRDGLVLVSVDAGALGEALKWEPSRGGKLFPHLHAPLDTGAAVAVDPLPLDPDGVHRFPPLK